MVSVARVMAERELEYARELKEMASRVRHPILKVLLKGIVRSIVFSMRLYWNPRVSIGKMLMKRRLKMK